MENMSSIKNHQKTLQKFRESFFLKMATKFLLPVLVFSVIVSYSSLLPFLLQFFNFSYSAYSKQLLGYNIDKNCMFLLCNGILVFIVKNSGVINTSPEETDFIAKNSTKNREFQQRVAKASQMEESFMKKEVVMEAQEEVTDTENVLSVEQDDVEIEKEQENESRSINEAEEEEEEEGIGFLSREELNKKCDDFIRKMKLGIKFEAQQPIMV